jgi:deoxyhypusine synthase
LICDVEILLYGLEAIAKVAMRRNNSFLKDKRTSHNPSGEKSKEIVGIPIKPFDAFAVLSVSDTLKAFSQTSFQSRSLAHCFQVLMAMMKDPERPTVFMGLAGAMVPAGMRKVLKDFMELHVVDVLVSTGANLSHDLLEALGFHHYIPKKSLPDKELLRLGIDRIYDTYVYESHFMEADKFVMEFAEELEPRSYSTREFLGLLGRTLKDPDSILATAAKEGIPIFCPAINDSSIGMALAALRQRQEEMGKKPLILDPLKDNLEILEIKLKSPRTGAIYVGGGVPKNYIQQLKIAASIIGKEVPGHDYAIQITTDDPKWGGLSGCTFEEAVSWGKISLGARYATVYLDATIGLPLLLRGLIELKEEWWPRKPLKLF